MNPVVAKCGHSFCRNCIHSCVPQRCPECRTVLTNTPLAMSVQLNKLVNKLEVFCPFQKEGCEWIGKREDLASHNAKTCLYAPWKCPHEGCPALSIKRKDSQPHEASCGYKLNDCSCGQRFRSKDRATHIEMCAAALIPCQQCHQVIPRATMKGHLVHSCPEAVCLCKYSEFGCTARVPRKILRFHLDNECLYAKLSGLLDTMKQKDQKIDALVQRISSLENTVQRLATSTNVSFNQLSRMNSYTWEPSFVGSNIEHQMHLFGRKWTLLMELSSDNKLGFYFRPCPVEPITASVTLSLVNQIDENNSLTVDFVHRFSAGHAVGFRAISWDDVRKLDDGWYLDGKLKATIHIKDWYK